MNNLHTQIEDGMSKKFVIDLSANLSLFPIHTQYYILGFIFSFINVYLLFQDAGYITRGSVKLQVNAILGDLTGISEVKKFSNMILPLAWADFVSI